MTRKRCRFLGFGEVHGGRVAWLWVQVGILQRDAGPANLNGPKSRKSYLFFFHDYIGKLVKMNEGVQLFVYTRAVRVHTYDVGSLRGLTRCAGRTPAGVQLDWLEHKRSISGVCVTIIMSFGESANVWSLDPTMKTKTTGTTQSTAPPLPTRTSQSRSMVWR